jgi:hypothetical protein
MDSLKIESFGRNMRPRENKKLQDMNISMDENWVPTARLGGYLPVILVLSHPSPGL